MSDYDDIDTMSLDYLEEEDQDDELDEDWDNNFDDMDPESWDQLYGDEEEEIEGDPWDLN